MSKATGKVNKWGAYICGDCVSGNHLGVTHIGLCQCTCDGHHDSKGNYVT
jgi:hypothetical protein